MLNKRIFRLFPAFVWIMLLVLSACLPVQAAGANNQKGNLSAEEQFRQVVLAKEAAQVQKEFEAAWQHADVALTASRF